jgi:dolichol kinase
MIPVQEIRRQIAHMLFGLILVVLLLTGLKEIFFFISIATIIFSFLMFKNVQIPFLSHGLAFFERNNEKDSVRARGLIYYALGATFVAELFPTDIAVAAILILALGDSCQRLMQPFGKTKHPLSDKRFIESAVVAGLIAFGAILNFVTWWHGLIAVIIAMLIEAKDMKIGWYKFDDNFLIPVFSALILYGFTFLQLSIF